MLFKMCPKCGGDLYRRREIDGMDPAWYERAMRMARRLVQDIIGGS